MDLRVVLVEPLYEGNVGSVARAMKNFGCNYSALLAESLRIQTAIKVL